MKIMTEVSKIAGRTGLKAQKYSPEILIGAGVTGIITASVLACKATMKMPNIVEAHKHEMNSLITFNETVNNEEDLLTVKEYKQEKVLIYVRTSADLVKLYGPPVLLGALSIGCILGAHGVMRNRNFALMAAYKVIQEGYDAYRLRVIEEHGEEADYMYKHGLYKEEYTEDEIGEDGKKKKVKKTKIINKGGFNGYSRLFEEYNYDTKEGTLEWSAIPEYNEMFLKRQEHYFNQMLHARGHVLLHEIYDALGFERTQDSLTVGWVNDGTDGQISFGLNYGYGKLENARGEAWLLDFNVQGQIDNLLEA